MKKIKQLARIFVWASLLCFSSLSLADGISLRQLQFEQAEQSWVVNASYTIDLPADLSEAVKKGITFHFITELNVTRGRWYWFEEKPITAIKSIKLSYQPLTQVYRVSVGGLTLSATTLEEALLQIGAIAGWQVAEVAALDPSSDYDGAIRMRLDLSQLPKPFQINALNAREWNLSSGWSTFVISRRNRHSGK